MTIRRLAALVTALLMIGALVPLMMAPAFAAHVAPVLIEGNQNCAAVTGLEELTRFESNPVTSGTKNGVTITVNGDTFDWSSTVPVAAVYVKGGNNGNLYDYRPGGATGDSGLHAPVNPNNDKFYGLSHVTFCVPDDDTTTTTEATTTTTEPTTTTTEATTTTTEATTTTTEATTTTTEATTTTTEAEEQETTTTTAQEPQVGQETTSTTEAEIAQETTSTTSATEDTLPFTGVGTDGMALAALIALASGAGLISLTRGSSESEIEA